ncbi:MAG: hypothetical protein RIA62_09885 [Cyclobacteriaceae bacterium]
MIDKEKIRNDNIAFLASQGNGIDLDLPFIESDTKLRSCEEIGNRINVLHLLYAIYLEGEKSIGFLAI